MASENFLTQFVAGHHHEYSRRSGGKLLEDLLAKSPVDLALVVAANKKAEVLIMQTIIDTRASRMERRRARLSMVAAGRQNVNIGASWDLDRHS